MVWENQKPEDLIMYDIPDVFDEIPEEGFDDDEDRESYPKLNVLDYFTSLFKILNEKLLMNVPSEEKKFLNLKKWIWAGDALDVPEPKDRDEAQV